MDNSRQGTPHPDKHQSRLQSWQELEAKVPQLEKEISELKEENERLKNLLQAEQKEKTSVFKKVLATRGYENLESFDEETTRSELNDYIHWLSQEPEQKPTILLDTARELLSSIDNQSHAELTEEQAVKEIRSYIKHREEQAEKAKKLIQESKELAEKHKKQDEEWETSKKAALEQSERFKTLTEQANLEIEKAKKAARELENRNFKSLIVGCVIIGGAIVGLFMYFVARMYSNHTSGLEHVSSTALSSNAANMNISPSIEGIQNIRTPEPFMPFDIGR